MGPNFTLRRPLHREVGKKIRAQNRFRGSGPWGYAVGIGAALGSDFDFVQIGIVVIIFRVGVAVLSA